MSNLNYTRKSQEALLSAQQIGREYGSPQIEQPHLLYALLGRRQS